MILFKASGATYDRVASQSVHAFPYSPAEVRPDEFVLLSKNRADCAPAECQIQRVAKVQSVRAATPAELEELFPNVEAGQRWRFIARMYWVKRLDKPFNLSRVRGLNYKRYGTVVDFARIDATDELLLFGYLCKSNPEVVMDVVNNAAPPDGHNSRD